MKLYMVVLGMQLKLIYWLRKCMSSNNITEYEREGKNSEGGKPRSAEDSGTLGRRVFLSVPA